MYKGWIGIPVNYMYNSRSNIDFMNIKLRNEPIDWGSEYGDLLIKSLLLTDDEKYFGILRSTFEAQNHRHIQAALVPGTIVISLYTAAQYTNYKLKLLSKPFVVSVKQ